jgi:hypothetical protein
VCIRGHFLRRMLHHRIAAGHAGRLLVSFSTLTVFDGLHVVVASVDAQHTPWPALLKATG